MLFDILMIYLFVGVSVTLESLYRIGRLLLTDDKPAQDYRNNWKEIVAESHMPILLAAFLTVVIGSIQICLRILLWPVTVVALYIKYNKD
jgi:cytochrome b561